MAQGTDADAGPLHVFSSAIMISDKGNSLDTVIKKKT